jgi:hypothetical protein
MLRNTRDIELYTPCTPRVCINVSNGHASLAFEVQYPGDWRKRFIFYDELTPDEQAIVEQCLYNQGGDLRLNGWYLADESVKELAQAEHIQRWLRRQLSPSEQGAAWVDFPESDR